MNTLFEDNNCKWLSTHLRSHFNQHIAGELTKRPVGANDQVIYYQIDAHTPSKDKFFYDKYFSANRLPPAGVSHQHREKGVLLLFFKADGPQQRFHQILSCVSEIRRFHDQMQCVYKQSTQLSDDKIDEAIFRTFEDNMRNGSNIFSFASKKALDCFVSGMAALGIKCELAEPSEELLAQHNSGKGKKFTHLTAIKITDGKSFVNLSELLRLSSQLNRNMDLSRN